MKNLIKSISIIILSVATLTNCSRGTGVDTEVNNNDNTETVVNPTNPTTPTVDNSILEKYFYMTSTYGVQFVLKYNHQERAETISFSHINSSGEKTYINYHLLRTYNIPSGKYKGYVVYYGSNHTLYYKGKVYTGNMTLLARVVNIKNETGVITDYMGAKLTYKKIVTIEALVTGIDGNMSTEKMTVTYYAL